MTRRDRILKGNAAFFKAYKEQRRKLAERRITIGLVVAALLALCCMMV